MDNGPARSGRIRIYIGGTVHSVLFLEDGKHVLTGNNRGMLQRWRVDDGQEVGELIKAEGAQIYALALSPDGKWIVGGLEAHSWAAGGNVRVWDVQTHKMVLDIRNHKKMVWSIDISSDSKKFATGGFDKRVFIWSMTGERLIGPLKHEGTLVAVRFSPSGDRIATATVVRRGGWRTRRTYDAPPYLETRSIRIYDSETGLQLLDIPLRFSAPEGPPSPLAWSADGRRLYAGSCSEVNCFDTFSGSLLSKWSVPEQESSTSIVLARNEKFLVAIAEYSLFFWDTSTGKQIGTAFKYKTTPQSIALSPKDDCLVIGLGGGDFIIQSLRDILPRSYLTRDVNLPLMDISRAAFKSWTQGDLTSVEEVLTQEATHIADALNHAGTLAQRALVQTRLKLRDMAIDDANKSIKIQRSVIGYIARALALVSSGQHDSAMDAFDIALTVASSGKSTFLLLIKAIAVFECGKHDSALSRVGHLISAVDDDDQFPYVVVKDQMLLLLGTSTMREGDPERAVKLFQRAKTVTPVRPCPQLVTISLMFGWNFGWLAPAIQLRMWEAMLAMGSTHMGSLPVIIETLGELEEPCMSEITADWDPDLIQKCLTTLERDGDVATKSQNARRAIASYSAALSMKPSKPSGLLVKRSAARGMLNLWRDALKDADEAIKADPSNPWAYERRYAALHNLRRHDGAMDAFIQMLSLIEGSADHELAKKCVPSPKVQATIKKAVDDVSGKSPLVLIDVKSGELCDRWKRLSTFQSESQCKELIFSMTESTDEKHIQQVVEKYFRYVTLSHVWQGREPLLQDVERVGTVWGLDSSPTNDKLRKFCEVVRSDGYRWAWSDACCIDKTISTVLNQSLKMMYKWYEASMATFVYLVDVDSISALGDLTESNWMRRAWTSQELLAPKVIRFYTHDWEPYLGDTRSNHKESPGIMQELADAIKVARQTIITFNPNDLSVRDKLRLASKRNATVEEDVAYALIGIFQSDIRPEYGEGDAAMGHLLEEIVTRSGEVTVLDWTGKSSSYNSCLPATLGPYSQPAASFSAVDDAEMGKHVSSLRGSLSETDAARIHDRVACLPGPRFSNRRLSLPCIIFPVEGLTVQTSRGGTKKQYCATLSGVGQVKFQTSDAVPLKDPCKLIFVHPWTRDLCDPRDRFAWNTLAVTSVRDTFPMTTMREDMESEEEESSESDASDRESFHDAGFPSERPVVPATPMDDYTRALRLVVRLQQPFHTLLLEQQPSGEFKRIAAQQKIVAPGIDRSANLAEIVHTGVVEVL